MSKSPNNNNKFNKFWTKLFKPNEIVCDIIEFLCDAFIIIYVGIGVIIMILFGPLRPADNDNDDKDKDTSWIIKMLKYLFLNPTADDKKSKEEKDKDKEQEQEEAKSSTSEYVLEDENGLTAQCRLDCDVCMLPLPLDPSQTSYQGCCGKTLCNGCIVKDVLLSSTQQQGNQNQNQNRRTQTKTSSMCRLCPFCRSKPPSNNKEAIEQTERRIENSNGTDRLAIYQMGLYYMEGKYGLKKNPLKAIELYFERAAALGCPEAAHSLACVYDPEEINWGCSNSKDNKYSPDPTKQKLYLEQASKGGHLIARHRLSYMYYESKDYKMAVHHALIAASGGNKSSLKVVTNLYKLGHVKKDDLETCLRSNQAANDDRTSPDREIAINVQGTNHMEDLFDAVAAINNKKKKQKTKHKKRH